MMDTESDLTIWHRNMCRLKDELAIANERIAELENGLSFQRRLLAAVVVPEFDGIRCENVDGKNWFDLRDLLLRKNR